jgi:hypothetical protein
MPCEPVCDVADDPCVEPCWPEFVRVVVVVVLDDVVDEVCPELDEVLGLVCAIIHVAQKSSTESNVILLFIKPSRGLVLNLYPVQLLPLV